MRIGSSSRLLVSIACLLGLAGPALARSPYFVPAPGDTSLAARCRSEASMIGGGGGRGATTRAEQVRAMRAEYRRKCLQGQ